MSLASLIQPFLKRERHLATLATGKLPTHSQETDLATVSVTALTDIVPEAISESPNFSNVTKLLRAIENQDIQAISLPKETADSWQKYLDYEHSPFKRASKDQDSVTYKVDSNLKSLLSSTLALFTAVDSINLLKPYTFPNKKSSDCLVLEASKEANQINSDHKITVNLGDSKLQTTEVSARRNASYLLAKAEDSSYNKHIILLKTEDPRQLTPLSFNDRKHFCAPRSVSEGLYIATWLPEGKEDYGQNFRNLIFNSQGEIIAPPFTHSSDPVFQTVLVFEGKEVVSVITSKDIALPENTIKIEADSRDKNNISVYWDLKNNQFLQYPPEVKANPNPLPYGSYAHESEGILIIKEALADGRLASFSLAYDMSTHKFIEIDGKNVFTDVAHVIKSGETKIIPVNLGQDLGAALTPIDISIPGTATKRDFDEIQIISADIFALHDKRDNKWILSYTPDGQDPIQIGTIAEEAIFKFDGVIDPRLPRLTGAPGITLAALKLGNNIVVFDGESLLEIEDKALFDRIEKADESSFYAWLGDQKFKLSWYYGVDPVKVPNIQS